MATEQTGLPGSTAPPIRMLNKGAKDAKAAKQKQTKQLIFLGVLLVVFAYVFYANVLKKDTPPPAPQPAPPQQPTQLMRVSQTIEKTPSQLSSGTQSELGLSTGSGLGDESWGRSPFALNGADEEDEDVVFELEGIVSDENSAFAIIGKKIVKPGDRLVDNTVKEIHKDHVVLVDDEGEETVLRI